MSTRENIRLIARTPKFHNSIQPQATQFTRRTGFIPIMLAMYQWMENAKHLSFFSEDRKQEYLTMNFKTALHIFLF